MGTVDESHSSELLKVGRQFTHILQHVTERGADTSDSLSVVLLKEGRMVTTRSQQHITERGENARSAHAKVLLKEGRKLTWSNQLCY